LVNCAQVHVFHERLNRRPETATRAIRKSIHGQRYPVEGPIMSDEQWQGRIEGALNAHFKQPDGSSRPGTDWKIGLRRGDETRTVIVRAYLADTVSAATRGNTNYQGQTVLGYVFDRLAAGWIPADGPPAAMTILDPSPGQAVPALPQKRGLLSRLLGR
jgi:hypothetical protein